MKKELNYFELFNDALSEKGVTIADLENKEVIAKFVFYKFKLYCPSLKNAIKIANYLEMSLDYILYKKDLNLFKKYDLKQESFYSTIGELLSNLNISKRKFCMDLNFSDAIFTRWKHGATPKLSTIINISNYLGCNIDDLLSKDK